MTPSDDDFLVAVDFDQLPKGSRFYTSNFIGIQTPQVTKITKRNVLYRDVLQRFQKPKSRKVYLCIPRQKYVDFCYENNYIKNSPSTQELIELHNQP